MCSYKIKLLAQDVNPTIPGLCSKMEINQDQIESKWPLNACATKHLIEIDCSLPDSGVLEGVVCVWYCRGSLLRHKRTKKGFFVCLCLFSILKVHKDVKVEIVAQSHKFSSIIAWCSWTNYETSNLKYLLVRNTTINCRQYVEMLTPTKACWLCHESVCRVLIDQSHMISLSILEFYNALKQLTICIDRLPSNLSMCPESSFLHWAHRKNTAIFQEDPWSVFFPKIATLVVSI